MEAEMSHVFVRDLAETVTIPERGIVSHTVHSDAHVKIVMFGFDVGQELSEHNASMPAIIHILKGDAQITLGTESVKAGAGTWIHMPAGLPHSMQAETPLLMLLTLVKGGKVN
jgi:quercetin dioxygenase-like cupin family protein